MDCSRGGRHQPVFGKNRFPDIVKAPHGSPSDLSFPGNQRQKKSSESQNNITESIAVLWCMLCHIDVLC